MRAAVLGAIVAAREHGLDPEWPPVLVALVLLLLAGLAISVFVVYRALRTEARAGRRHRGSGGAVR